MKKVLLLACFGIFCFGSVHAQKLDFTIKTDSIIIDNSKTYKITVEITKGTGPFTYYLCDKEPWFGGKILEQFLDISSPIYSFSNQSTILNRMVLVKGIGKDDYNWKPVSARKANN